MKTKLKTFMYTPAILTNVVEKLGKWKDLDNICFDFEDGLAEHDLYTAESGISSLLEKVSFANKHNINIFIRVRNPKQFQRIAPQINLEQITGFVFPKITTENFSQYIDTYLKYKQPHISFIPILESAKIAEIKTRQSELINLHEQFKELKNNIVCVQIGAVDLCGIYGLRRSLNHTIYDIKILNSIISDILSIYLQDFILLGSVFEYFSGDFEKTLYKETELDRLNGFSGKLAIHPNQLSIINKAFTITKDEIEEANQLLNTNLSVVKSISGRMNEKSTHMNWAKRILNY